MSLFSSKHLYILISFGICLSTTWAGDGFPIWDNPVRFKQDLRRTTLATNLPNITETGHTLGVQLKVASIFANSDETLAVPGGRLTIYPNPGYNIWVQLSSWPGSTPSFGVGTGIQVEFQGDNPKRRQAVGLTWNEIHADGYAQRDISFHGLYGFSSKELSAGIIFVVDLHHVIVENGNGIPDYDETIYIAVPYISWLWKESFRMSMMLPLNSTGPGLILGGEFMIGKRS